MHDAKAIESILSRLMPPALSDAAQHDLESLLDELAATTPDIRPAAALAERPRHWLPITGIAAAIVAVAGISHLLTPTLPSITARDATPDVPSIELVGESDYVESMQDDGWRETPEGSAMHALLMRVVEENSLLDHETGIVMRISEPRDELLLMPVSAF
jgi:hypothetical protein